MRIEVFVPDNPNPAYHALLTALEREFVYTFGGCTITPHFEGRYWSDTRQTTIHDPVRLIFTDTDLTPARDMHALTTYLDELYATIAEALEEEDLLIAVHTVSHVLRPSEEDQ
ncbi:MAG: hypothetical protein OEY63_07345 [Gemmatimonadota bacterium]|nr:hypothetical protein [Gemmatimonadota bacterium]